MRKQLSDPSGRTGQIKGILVVVGLFDGRQVRQHQNAPVALKIRVAGTLSAISRLILDSFEIVSMANSIALRSCFFGITITPSASASTRSPGSTGCPPITTGPSM